MMHINCESKLIVNEVNIDDFKPFQMFANSINPKGFEYQICFECYVKHSSKVFNSKFNIIGEEDCSKALVPSHFKIKYVVSYKDTVVPEKLGDGYQNFFRKRVNGCFIDQCILRDINCKKSIDQINVFSTLKEPFFL